jgi:UDP-N-acetylmuramyl pentapeptide phosphotransferase/UDP-N-acetylglucosamine-1-phosphate transferase
MNSLIIISILSLSAVLISVIFFSFYIKIMEGKSLVKQSKLIPNKKKILGEGGLPFFATFFFLLILILLKYYDINLNNKNDFHLLFFLFCILIFVFISYLDDKYDLSKFLRFVIQLTCVFLSLSFLNTRVLEYLPLKLELIILIFFWVYIINVTNFIDGLNGFLALNCISFFFGTLIILNNYNLHSHFIFIISLISINILFVFLYFNFIKTKIFLGDTGSIPLGFIIGYVTLYLLELKIFIPLLFLFIYPILDVTLTILNKVFLRKQYPWERLFDYFFLKPVIKGKQTHEFVFYRVFILNIVNMLLLVIYLKTSNLFTIPVLIVANFYCLKFFSKF